MVISPKTTQIGEGGVLIASALQQRVFTERGSGIVEKGYLTIEKAILGEWPS